MVKKNVDNKISTDFFTTFQTVAANASDPPSCNSNKSIPLLLTIRSLEGLVVPRFVYDNFGTVSLAASVQVSFYDSKNKQFFGNTYKGPKKDLSMPPSERKTISLRYDEPVFFKTSIIDLACVAVLEIVLHVMSNGIPVCKLSAGWSLARFFGSILRISDSQSKKEPHVRRIEVYHGTPRVLMFASEPLAEHCAVVPRAGCTLAFTLQTHSLMTPVMHLFSENQLLRGTQVVPGIWNGGSLNEVVLFSPRLIKPHRHYIQHIKFTIKPSLKTFEHLLLKRLNINRLKEQQAEEDPGSKSVKIIDRFVRIGIHNGLTFVGEPRAASVVRDANSLVCHHIMQFGEYARDPSFAIVISLEYKISVPFAKGKRNSSLRAAGVTERMITIGWTTVFPLNDEHFNVINDDEDMDRERSFKLLLSHLPGPNPFGALIYSNLSVDDTSATALQLEFSFVPEGSEERPSNIINTANHALSSSQQNALHPKTLKQKKSQVQHGSTAVDSRNSSRTSRRFSSPSASFRARSTTPPVSNSAEGIEKNVGQMKSRKYDDDAGGEREVDIGQEDGEGAAMLETMPTMTRPLLVPSARSVMSSGKPSSCLSRAAEACLFTSNFPEIVDVAGRRPSDLGIVRPFETSSVDMPPIDVNVAMTDPRTTITFVLQFLAIIKPSPNGPAAEAGVGEYHTIRLTYQFYRFPIQTTRRICVKSDDDTGQGDLPCLLKVYEDAPGGQQVLSQSSGVETKFEIDTGNWRPDERRHMFAYLQKQALQVDIWDGDSLLHIGTANLELKYLLRQNCTSVQVTQDADIVFTDISPAVSETFVRGRIIARLASLGREPIPTQPGLLTVDDPALCLRRLHQFPCIIDPVSWLKEHSAATTAHTKENKIPMDAAATSTSSPYANISYVSLNAMRSASSQGGRSQGRLMVTQDPDLAAALFSRHAHSSRPIDESDHGGDPRLRRMLQRLQAAQGVKKSAQAGGPVGSTVDEKIERQRDLKTISIYRERQKHSKVTALLSSAITLTTYVYPSSGTACFFEYVLTNPYRDDHTFYINFDDSELNVITNVQEWRHFQELFNVTSPVEEGLIHVDVNNNGFPEVFLHAQESVHIPFKFQSFKTGFNHSSVADSSTTIATSMNHSHQSMPFYSAAAGRNNDPIRPRSIHVRFLNMNKRPVYILEIVVCPQASPVSQIFRFYHAENQFLKRAIRVPQKAPLMINATGHPEYGKVVVHCSDSNVIVECREETSQKSDTMDVYFKYACGAAPEVNCFYLLLFNDPFHASPYETWQFYVHSLQRVDLTGIIGETTCGSLVLRGAHSARRVHCFSSHPLEMRVDPRHDFPLVSNALNEVKLAMRPKAVGSKDYQVNIVDSRSHMLVNSWLVAASFSMPLITKAFELNLDATRTTNKRVSFTNPYQYEKVFVLYTNHEEVVTFKDDKITIPGGESRYIGLRFLPTTNHTSYVEVLIFINDEEDKNEECFSVRAVYQTPMR